MRTVEDSYLHLMRKNKPTSVGKPKKEIAVGFYGLFIHIGNTIIYHLKIPVKDIWSFCCKIYQSPYLALFATCSSKVLEKIVSFLSLLKKYR